MGFPRALVALDLSPVSDIVVEGVGQLKGLGVKRVMLLHVIPLTLIDHPAAGIPADKIVEEEAARAKRLLEAYRVRLEKLGFEVEVLEPPLAEPAPAIASYAEKLHADLVVVGGKGRSWLREILAGSTVEEVVRLSPKPVLVYKKVDGDVAQKPIVVGVDVEHIDPQLPECISHIEAAKAIFLAYIDEWRIGASNALEKLDKLAERLRGLGVRAEIHRVYCGFGTPARGLIELAERLGSRLIVVSWRGRGSLLRRLLLGTTADAVVRHSPVPVLVCRGR